MVAESNFDKAKMQRLISSTVRMLCKPTSLGERGYVLKFTGPAMVRLSAISPLFPNARCLFVYRDTIKVICSL